MISPIIWEDPSIIHITRHGWQVTAAQPWANSSVPLARKNDQILGLNRDLPICHQGRTDGHKESSSNALHREKFGPRQFRSIWLGRKFIGYLFYGQRNSDFGLPVIGIIDAPRRQGLGSAVLMALLYGVHLAGGSFEIIDVDNPWAFQKILVAEGFGTAQVHLVRNELLLNKTIRARGMEAYPRKQVALSDFRVEEVGEIPHENQPYLTGIPIEQHAWWIERIVVPPKI